MAVTRRRVSLAAWQSGVVFQFLLLRMCQWVLSTSVSGLSATPRAETLRLPVTVDQGQSGTTRAHHDSIRANLNEIFAKTFGKLGLHIGFFLRDQKISRGTRPAPQPKPSIRIMAVSNKTLLALALLAVAVAVVVAAESSKPPPASLPLRRGWAGEVGCHRAWCGGRRVGGCTVADFFGRAFLRFDF